jgi:hypothetical protein
MAKNLAQHISRSMPLVISISPFIPTKTGGSAWMVPWVRQQSASKTASLTNQNAWRVRGTWKPKPKPVWYQTAVLSQFCTDVCHRHTDHMNSNPNTLSSFPFAHEAVC